MAFAAGCGGDDDGGDEDAIKETIRTSLTTHDPEGDCNERLSDALVQRTYGTRSRCEQIQGDNSEENDAESVDFRNIEVDGDSATAEIEASGGSVGRVDGALEMVREDGAWRIDGLSVPLLRTLVEAAFAQTDDLPAGGADCLQRQAKALPDAEFREFGYEAIGQRQESQARIFEFLAECEGEGGVSLLRGLFEEGITESLRARGTSQEEIDCVLAGIRRAASDDELIELLKDDNSQAAVQEALAPAINACS